MGLSDSDRSLLKAAQIGGTDTPDGFCKCASVLRRVIEAAGDWDDATNFAVCNTGYEHPVVAKLYEGIRTLVAEGMLDGRGDLNLPAGPRYTECRITYEGSRAILLK